MSLFFKKFLGFSMGPIVGSFISFITIPLSTYFISPDEYGKGTMFTLFQSLIITFLYLGLDQSYTREYHETKDKESLLKNAMLLPLILSLVVFILICLNLNFFSKVLFGSPDFTLATILFGLTINLLVLERFILLSIRMEEKAFEYSILNILLKLGVLISTIIFVLFIRRDFLAVVYSTVYGQVIADLYLIFRYRNLINYRFFHINISLIKKMIKFGTPLVISSILFSLLQTLDRIYLRLLSDFYEIGLFTAALKISNLLLIIQTSFVTFWVPTAYRWYSQNKEIKYYEFISRVVLLFMSLLLCIILLCKEYITILLGHEYTDIKYIIGFLCLYPIMYTLSETTTLGITFSRKSYYNLWVSFLALIPNMFLNYLLIPSYGAIGAAIATGTSYILFFIARSYFSNKLWEGFKTKIHITVSATLFTMSFINTQDFNHINFINILFTVIIILIQTPTIKKLVKIYKGKEKEEWNFS